MLTSIRSHWCVDVAAANPDTQVSLCGWVARRRDHGGVLFFDLRDRSGLVQIVCDPACGEAFKRAEELRSEYVVRVCGTIRLRTADTVNEAMVTGRVEVVIDELFVLNTAKTLPLQIDEHQQVGEEHRLKYRYLDLRRQELQENIALRSLLLRCARDFLIDAQCLEIETPVLTRPTPEGARDFLVPSRLQPGNLFALPQSPQLFKQLLMVSGFDRYFQIAKCFRDEDLRADRQPEFTQIDIELSFVSESDVMDLAEALISAVYRQLTGGDLPPFPRLDYRRAIAEFGTDKPDLRNPLRLVDISDLLTDVQFRVFREPAVTPGHRIVVLRLPSATDLSRSEIDRLTAWIVEMGASGLAWIRVVDIGAGISGLQSPILKFLPEQVVIPVLQRCGAASGDILFFGAGLEKLVNTTMSALMARLAEQRGLLASGWRPLWLVDFPAFERNAAGGIDAVHHPFTAPECTVDVLRKNPLAASSRAYDLVINGHEVGGGSVRISDAEMQYAVFEILGFSRAEARQRFGFLLDALGYGCPPHGGIAFGVDRLTMLFGGASAIRDVIAFPKTQSGSCPLTGAPAPAAATQLAELGIVYRKRKQVGAK